MAIGLDRYISRDVRIHSGDCFGIYFGGFGSVVAAKVVVFVMAVV